MGNFNFGNYICELREKKGLSQAELGEKLGVTNKAVSKWENGGGYPSTELMLPLAEALGVPLENLYRAITDSKAPKTKARIVLDFLVQNLKTVRIICLALALIPYILFAAFVPKDDDLSLLWASPLACTIAYFWIYFGFTLSMKSSLTSKKTIDFYCIIIVFVLALGYVFLIKDFIIYFPTGFSISTAFAPVTFLAVLSALKKRYK